MLILFNNHLFENPISVIKCFKLSEVARTFDQMEKALAKGLYLAGFLSYEAGYAFEKNFWNNKFPHQNPVPPHQKFWCGNKTYDFPLVCFGAYAKPTSPPPRLSSGFPPLHQRWRGGLKGVRIKKDYFKALRKIKAHLAAGDTYQVNYTFKCKFDFEGNPFDLYQRLKQQQSTPYSTFIETDDFSILSLSPELFFRKHGNKIKVKPMKGTIGLGKGNRQRLRDDPKNQAENIMIVDLLRNDLGRVAKTGSVRTTKLFEVEKLKTLYQMTSTIEAEIPKNIELHRLFRNIFPSGSVTGAPKIRTMQIIQNLEKEERKIYCGSIGYITPQKDMLFNVAIRTILLSTRDSCLPAGTARLVTGEMGLGSGIVYDSDPKKEFEECLLKARFLDKITSECLDSVPVW